MSLLSTSAAARRADCSPDTIRRACQKGELACQLVDGKRGPVWKIDADALNVWIEQREEERRARFEEAELISSASEPESAANPQGRSTAAEGAHYNRSETAGVTQERSGSAAAHPQDDSSTAAEPPQGSGVPAAVHLALVDELRRADRQIMALQYQLGQERRLLSEQAESIVEREALARQAEAQKAAVEEEIEKAKAQQEELASQLKQARAELAKWEEQRQRPWWKKMFG